MDDSALNDPLKSGCGFGINIGVGNKVAEFSVNILHQIASEQIQVNPAGPHHGGRICIIGQRVEQMLQSRIFLTPLIGLSQSVVESFFETS